MSVHSESHPREGEFNSSFSNQQDRNNHIFRQEYDYWRTLGHAHVVCQRKAIDYYRKFLKREVTVNWEAVADDLQAREGTYVDEALEQVQFNGVVRNVLSQLTLRQQELFCYIIVQQDLDRHLDADLAAAVANITKNQRPTEVKEMAECMGLALNGIGVCTPIAAVRGRIREVFIKNGFCLGKSVGNNWQCDSDFLPEGWDEA